MIHSIYLSKENGGKQQQVDRVDVVAQKGAVGDRNFGKTTWPGQNLTLVQLEKIEAFCRNHSIQFDASLTRRNIVTQGVDLNSLVGKNFRLGDVVLKGIELCEPCADLGKQLANDKYTAAALVRALVGNGGLRVDIESGGTLSVGMEFQSTTEEIYE